MKLLPLVGLSDKALALLAVARQRGRALSAGVVRTISDRIYAVRYSATRVLLFKHGVFAEKLAVTNSVATKFSYVKLDPYTASTYRSYNPITGVADGRFAQDISAYSGTSKTVYDDGTVLGETSGTYVSVNKMGFPELCAIGSNASQARLAGRGGVQPATTSFDTVLSYVGTSSALYGLSTLFPYEYAGQGGNFHSDRVLSVGETVLVGAVGTHRVTMAQSSVAYPAAQDKLLSDEVVSEFAALSWPFITGNMSAFIHASTPIPDGVKINLYVLWFWINGVEHGCIVVNPAIGLYVRTGTLTGSCEFAVKGKATLTYSSGSGLFSVTEWTPSVVKAGATQLDRFAWNAAWEYRSFVAMHPSGSSAQLEAYYLNLDGEPTIGGPYHTEDACLSAIKQAVAVTGI